MGERRKAQKITYYIALLCYLLAVCCIALTAYMSIGMEEYDSVVASLGATAVFFIGTGVVLHVIGKADLPNLKIDSESDANSKKMGSQD